MSAPERITPAGHRRGTRRAWLLKRFGGVRLIEAFWLGRRRLTVLAYHRIGPVPGPDADFLDIVSATPEAFEQQMEWVRSRFDVIGVAALADHVTNGAPLPRRPLLITFDDGYLDNYEVAAPVLRRLGLPAVFFIVTGAMGQPAHMWWDQLAMAFQRTARATADLPYLGAVPLGTVAERQSGLVAFIEALKTVPNRERLHAIDSAHTILGVPRPEPGAGPPFMTWEHVRELVAAGIDCQPHTATHPILSRVDLAQLKEEIGGAAEACHLGSGQPSRAFAYPNGTPADYGIREMDLLRSAGIEVAFTTDAGPTTLARARRDPLRIPRVGVHHADTLEKFALNVSGLTVVRSRLRRG